MPTKRSICEVISLRYEGGLRKDEEIKVSDAIGSLPGILSQASLENVFKIYKNRLISENCHVAALASQKQLIYQKHFSLLI